MNEERLTELARVLIAQTSRDATTWKVIDADDPTSFRCDLLSGFVVIRSRDGDNQPPYVFSVYPPEGGRPMETLETTSGRPSNWNTHLAQLYGLVRNQALGIDKRLDTLLAEAKRKEPESPDDDIPF
jgi:hypothetical protein